MGIKLGFEIADLQLTERLRADLLALFGPQGGVVLEAPGVREGDCDIVLIREPVRDWNALRADRREAMLVCIGVAGEGIPDALLDGSADAAIGLPLRDLELLSLFRQAALFRGLRENQELQSQLVLAVDRLQEDVALAERLQTRMLPRRFTDIRGFQIHNRYLAGLRGGDWFDIAEARDGSALHFVLSDGSSSGLSSGVGAALTRVAMRVSLEGARSPVETVRALNEELQTIFTEKHRLSLLYGIVARSDLRFRWVSLGNARIFHARGSQGFRRLDTQGEILRKGALLPDGLMAGELSLEPQDRVLMLSDGFLEGVGGEQEMESLLKESGESAEKVLNDLAWRIRKGLSDEELPAQECSALWIQVDSNVIRLAR